eukprot:6838477-Pyramimonas_sp.AAC.1
MLDPPPPKKKKAKDPADPGTQPAAAAHGGMHAVRDVPVYCDRSLHVPKGQSVWLRYDANATRYHASLPGGPDWRR